MKKNLPTVTVAISALNEENNILAFLNSVLSQKEEGFILEEILVVSDGSRDKTVQIAKSLNSSKIKVLDYKERAGKAQRLNEIYKLVESDILVQSDADVVFAHEFVIRDLTVPIIENDKIGMCGGNPIPIEAKTFTEKAVNCTVNAYAPLKKIRNISSVDGKLMAFRKELIKKLKIPDTIADDAYAYFASVVLGYKYAFVESAVVRYRSPQSLSDQIKQNTRFILIHSNMDKFFSKDIVTKEYRLASTIIYKLMAKQFLLHPILSSYIFIVNRYCKLRATYFSKEMNSKWSAAGSTKNLQNY